MTINGSKHDAMEAEAFHMACIYKCKYSNIKLQ